jgi:hypothetical protein
MFEQADTTDLTEGKLAYWRYHQMMHSIAKVYGHDVREVTAAFVALSPNSDYLGNLRSLISVLEGVRRGAQVDDITVATYKGCRDRAYAYVTKQQDFLLTARGPKIRAFYHNILFPDHKEFVTIDGHMVGAYRGNDGTMKENIVSPRVYKEVASTTKRLANQLGLIPNQLQAVIWFTRKRVLNVKYDGQMSLFGDSTDRWQTMVKVEEIKPYDTRLNWYE